jgi:quinol monooxygenase YgiN
VLEPGLIHVIEHWEDRATLEAHWASPHIQTWRAAWPALGIGARDLTLFEADDGRAC